jgi:molybdopterin converting factor small subunit
MAVVQIPEPYRKFTCNESECRFDGKTVGIVLKRFAAEYPEIGCRLFDDNGDMHSYLHIFIGKRDIKTMQELHTLVDNDTVIKLIPAIAGG